MLCCLFKYFCLGLMYGWIALLWVLQFALWCVFVLYILRLFVVLVMVHGHSISVGLLSSVWLVVLVMRF